MDVAKIKKDHPHSFSFVWGRRFGPTYPSFFGFSLALEARGHWILDSADLGGRKIRLYERWPRAPPKQMLLLFLPQKRLCVSQSFEV
jgi:hypothetical protein